MRTREALLPDAEQIHELIAAYSRRRDVAAAHLCRESAKTCATSWCSKTTATSSAAARSIFTVRTWPRFAPSPSIPTRQGSGGGERLVKALLARPKSTTSIPSACSPACRNSSARLGFAMAQREDLPDKIHKDCCVCPRFHQCDEVAMVRGELPKFAMLPRACRRAGEDRGMKVRGLPHKNICLPPGFIFPAASRESRPAAGLIWRW